MNKITELQSQLEASLIQIECEKSLYKQIKLFQDANMLQHRINILTKKVRKSDAKIPEPTHTVKMTVNGNRYVGGWRW